MIIKPMYLTPNQYSRPLLPLRKVNGLVVHWVANPGTSALVNRNYFENLKIGKKYNNGKYIFASGHFIIGLKGEIIQCIPLDEKAYHANWRNHDTIGIECCHPDWTGELTPDTLMSLKWLLSKLTNDYVLDPRKGIIRHFDVTGKDCPRWYVNNPKEWDKLREDVKNMSNDLIRKTAKVSIHGNEIEQEVIFDTKGINYVPLRFLEKIGYDLRLENNVININYKGEK